jgi:cellulose 1,4-beta-cellobiosidase
VVATVKSVVPPRTGADSYIEMSITPSIRASGIGAAGAISLLQVRLFSTDPVGGDVQSNDYSFDPSFTTFRDAPKITAYAGTTLIWGQEP